LKDRTSSGLRIDVTMKDFKIAAAEEEHTVLKDYKIPETKLQTRNRRETVSICHEEVQ
jgi:hypothetical protein